MNDRVFNFSPGPAVLPVPVLEQAQRELLALPGAGASVLEISHRGQPFTEILQRAEANLRRLLAVPENFKVLFLQGGSRLQFSMVPMNLLRGSGRPADYVVTGDWGEKALAEAKREGDARVAWDGSKDGYRRLPDADQLDLDPRAVYVHVTSNETIQGVQFPREIDTDGVPLVCDASSDFLSRPLAMDRYGLIYACAQKNAGPAGVTMVIVREDLIERVPDGLHSMLDYRQHAKNKSLLNTPPTFGVYLVMLVTEWLLNEIGGLEKMHQRNQRKAALLYDVVDASEGFYRGHAQKECRSLMNVTFHLPSDELQQSFLEQAAEHRLTALKGHRSVGGIRASIYNAMPIEGVETLAQFMTDFCRKS